MKYIYRYNYMWKNFILLIILNYLKITDDIIYFSPPINLTSEEIYDWSLQYSILCVFN